MSSPSCLLYRLRLTWTRFKSGQNAHVDQRRAGTSEDPWSFMSMGFFHELKFHRLDSDTALNSEQDSHQRALTLFAPMDGWVDLS